MSEIFLSYAREDLERAMAVASALERKGWSVWWDQRLLAGEVFDEVIEAELEAARAVVVLWTRASVQSRWVRKEAVEADEQRKLVPVRLDAVDLPLALRDVQTTSLTNWDGDPGDPSFEELVRAVRAVLERPREAPAGPPEATHPEPEPGMPPRPSRRWPRSSLARAGLLVAAVSGIVYAAARMGALLPGPTPAPTGAPLPPPSPDPGPSASATPDVPTPGPSVTPAATPHPTPSATPTPDATPTPVVSPPTPAPTPDATPTPVPAPTPTPIHLSTSEYRPGMRLIAAGSFTMGSPATEPGRQPDETPHPVRIRRSFYMAETEVTQAHYSALMGQNPSVWADRGENHPVESVSWYDALRYCNALSAREDLERCYVIEGSDVRWPRGLDCAGYRLPTEAEWEYAARAEHPVPHRELDLIAWHSENSEHRTQPVGLKRPNRWGLRDTLGNVWEWVWDAYAPYPPGPVDDPTGPATGAERVFRGCCLDNVPVICRVAYRDHREPGHRAYGLGLRPVRTLR